MKTAPAFAVLSLVLVIAPEVSAQAPAKAPSLAEARKNLDTARENLANAIKRIEKDPPNTEDLDAAHAAVGALKDAIDAGASHEPNDLGYAKAALAARKELRTQREYVDQRRANVHIHNHRRKIDAALAKLTEEMRAIEGKQPSQSDFDEARAAAANVKKTVNEGREFAKQDEKFGKFLEDTDATVARQEKAIGDRWVQLSADKHRAIVADARKSLSDSVAALGKGGTDAQFEAASKAADELSKRLEEGKPLEEQDKAYRADADKARNELAQAKKKMEQAFSEAGLERLKSEIEPAHKDLLAAGKALKARKPTEEQLAEARTAAIVVRKLVEKFQPQAQVSKPFAQYLNEVKKNLTEVEVVFQGRALEAAQKELTQALRRVEARNATDEHFAEATTAMTILDKTLEETTHKRDPAMLKPVADARELMRNAKATMAKRRVEVDVQKQRARVQEARKTAEDRVREIQQTRASADQLKVAEESVQQLSAVLEESAALAKKDRDFAQYTRDVKQRVTDLNDRIAKRRIALAAGDGRSKLSEAISDAKAKLETARQPTSTDADIDAAGKSVDALTQAIEAGAELEQKDAGYAASAERAREQLMRLMEGLEAAREARLVRKETVESFAAGSTAANEAASAKDLRAQRQHFEKAIARFKSCESDGSSMVKNNPALAKVAVLVDGNPSTARDVIALCAERTMATEQQLRQVMSILGFEEGPKRSYETAKALLAKSKKTEALPHFGECISSGRIHQYRYPEIKDQKFQVAGGSMTLAELIEQCVTQRKTLGGK